MKATRGRRRFPRRRILALLPASLSLLALGALASAGSYIPFEDLTDKDGLTAVLRRTARIEGRIVYYPAPPAEAEPELSRRSAAADAEAQAATRHLAATRRELGNLKGAQEAMTRWATASASEAAERWAETARWARSYRLFPFAFEAAEKALQAPAGAGSEAGRKKLASDRIDWAQAFPEHASAEKLVEARAKLFPEDQAFFNAWIQSLEKSNRIKDAEEALRKNTSLSEENRAVLVARLKKKSGDGTGALSVLETFISRSGRAPQQATSTLFSEVVLATAPSRVDEWRATLDKKFDATALLLLEVFFKGKGRGDLALQLLQQSDARHLGSVDRKGAMLLAQLYEGLNAVPEAFRTRLASSRNANEKEKLDDLAALASLALKAGSRPLAWGQFNEEPYRWAARIDVTPGFFTGGLSLLLTGFDGKASLSELENQRLPDRTFRTAQALIAELEKRSPTHPSLPALALGTMEKLVQRSEGSKALELLPKADKGTAELRAAARKVALLAIRQTKAPLDREAGLWKERLALLAPDGSKVTFQAYRSARSEEDENDEANAPGAPAESRGMASPEYQWVLQEALSRLSSRDKSNAASLALLLNEMDRLPKAEPLWTYACNEIERWTLDSTLESRYKHALKTFEGTEWWKRVFRWYVRQKRGAEQRALADEVVATFRTSEIFRRDPGFQGAISLEGQPNPFITISDYIRLKALERFPASPQVLREAESRLISRSIYQGLSASDRAARQGYGIVEDALLELRRDAVLFIEPARRAAFLDRLMKENRLEAFLKALEASPEKTPVELRFLSDGWSRLSKFELAAGYALKLSELYPAAPDAASDAITLHRSISGLSPAMAEKVLPMVRRLAATGADATALWTNAGEMWQDLDQPGRASEAFERILEPGPREPSRILDLATVYWDYGRMDEAERVLRDGRKRISEPSLHAFEAGVLREEKKDIDGALTEYLAALDGEGEASEESSWDPHDYRALRRLTQLLGRQRVLAELEKRVRNLKPGVAEDEKRLLPLLYLLNSEPETVEDSWDDWIDMPNDPVGREQRAQKREKATPAQERGMTQIGALLSQKTLEMIPLATNRAFLASLRGFQTQLLDPRWTKDPMASSRLQSLLLEREAALMPTEEERIQKELARIAFFIDHNQQQEARQALTRLDARVNSLSEGGLKIRSQASLAQMTERLGGDAAAAFRSLTDRYPWSLGVIEDRIAFCYRNKRTAEALDVLEKAAVSAASGHKEKLSERLVRESLENGDLPRAKKALTALLGMNLDPALRVSAVGLMGRLSLRENPSFDAITFAKTEAAKLPEEVRPDLWAAVARGARQEGRGRASVDLWIEAINRRTLREWLVEASQTATQFQLEAILSKFFESQRVRSPRDVRWAVAVRELRTQAGDLAGAIQAAKEVCGIAPEKEIYWRDAVDLFSRAGQFVEAATFLEGWASSRKGDERTASWRADLLLRGGQTQKAMEVERAALEAWKKESSQSQNTGDVESELAERTARVARRFLERNRPSAAWAFAVPGGKLSRSAEIPLDHTFRTDVAVRTGNLLALLKANENDSDFLEQSAETISQSARGEDLAALQEYLLSKVFPQTGPPSDAALKKFDQFARSCGLYRWDEALARNLAARTPGPWGTNPPVGFLRRISPTVSNPTRLAKPNLEYLWVQHLIASDDVPALRQAIAPRLSALDSFVSTGTSAAPAATSLFPVEALVRIAQAPDGAPAGAGAPASAGAETRAMLSRWFKTKETYQRLAQAVGSRWDLTSLLKLTDEETVTAWLLHAAPGRKSLDPVDEKRWRVEVDTARALASLIEGKAGALQSPEIARLRGPRTVGDVMTTDPKWVWPDFQPRPTDHADEAIYGAGVDRGRTPGRLWGGRPGDAWYVLESLARYREKDPKAPYVPLEAAARGNEADRTLLGVRTSEGLQNLSLALALDEAYFADLSRADRLERRMRLLIANGGEGKAKAEELLKKEVVRLQGTASETLFRQWEGASARLSLSAPGDFLDPAKPVSAPLLAYLLDVSDLKKYSNLKPANHADLKTALANRWYGAQSLMSREELDYYLRELWATGSGTFPARAVKNIQKMWPEAIEYLSGVPALHRQAALSAVKSLPDPKPVASVVDQSGDRRETAQLLLFRAELASSQVEAAMARARLMTGDTEAAALTLAPAVLSSEASEEHAEAGEEGGGEPADSETESASSRLRRLLTIARAVKNPAGIQETEAYLRDLVKKRLENRVLASGDAWILAVDLATPATIRSTSEALERAWIRGEYFSFADKAGLVGALFPKDPAAARTWFTRMERASDLATMRKRSELLVTLGRPEDAAREWIETRTTLRQSPQIDLQSFDAWRRLPAAKAGTSAPAAPDAWQKAAAFWKKPAAELDPAWGESFAAHLAKSPYDRLAARNVLRSLAPARADYVEPAVAALNSSEDVAAWRIARSVRPRSAVAARNALPSQTVDVNSLRTRRFLKTEIEGLLSDLARIGAANELDGLVSKATAGLDVIKPGASRALQPELTALKQSLTASRGAASQAFLRGGQYLPIRPRDLDWALYARVLNQEKVP